METKEQPKIPEGLYEKIRVSISNLVRECRVKETGETHFIGSLARNDTRGFAECLL